MRDQIYKFLNVTGLQPTAKRIHGEILATVLPTYFLRSLPVTARSKILRTGDPVRFGSMYLALMTLEKEGISGALAEAGVYKGRMSQFLHDLAPARTLYLFDTFSGFPREDAQDGDDRFRDTSLEEVKRTIGNLDNVIFREGYFPETTAGLEHERFALAILDLDLFKPTLAGLEFFYPRLVSGGYLFLHDYNAPESDWATQKAVQQYMYDKPEKPLELLDIYGSAVIRKH